MKTIHITKAHDITAFCLSEHEPGPLSGVHYNYKKKRLEATNRRIMVLMGVLQKDLGETAGFPTKNCIIPQSVLKRALSGSGESGVKLRVLRGEMELESDQPKTVVSCPKTDEQYPDSEMCLPTSEPTLTMCFSAHYLALLGELAKHVRDNTQEAHPPVKMEFYGQHMPMKLSATLTGGVPLTALLMPLSIPDKK